MLEGLDHPLLKWAWIVNSFFKKHEIHTFHQALPGIIIQLQQGLMMISGYEHI